MEFRVSMNLDEDKFHFLLSQNSNWNLAFLPIMNVHKLPPPPASHTQWYLLAVPVTLSPVETRLCHSLLESMQISQNIIYTHSYSTVWGVNKPAPDHTIVVLYNQHSQMFM